MAFADFLASDKQHVLNFRGVNLYQGARAKTFLGAFQALLWHLVYKGDHFWWHIACDGDHSVLCKLCESFLVRFCGLVHFTQFWSQTDVWRSKLEFWRGSLGGPWELFGSRTPPKRIIGLYRRLLGSSWAPSRGQVGGQKATMGSPGRIFERLGYL